MPNSNDSAKRDRQGKAARARNRAYKSSVRTVVKATEARLSAGDKVAAGESLLKMIKALDAAARKRILSKNSVARKKSRLQKRFNAL